MTGSVNLAALRPWREWVAGVIALELLLSRSDEPWGGSSTGTRVAARGAMLAGACLHQGLLQGTRN